MPSYELTRCAVCGHADTTELAGADDIRVEAELLWAFHMRRLSPRTPPSRLVDRVAFSQAPPWRVVRCKRCGLVYRNPAESRDAVRATYAGEQMAAGVLRGLHDAQRRVYRRQAGRVTRYLERHGTGLEVGSYVGAFLAAAWDAGWRFEGLDVNPHVNAFARSLGFTVHDGDIEHFGLGRTFDAVAIWNTFDQLPDPRVAVRAAARLLRPGGLLAIRVPNGECYARWRPRLRRRGTAGIMAVSLLAHNNLLTFPYRFGYTPASLTRLLGDCGFNVTAVIPEVLLPRSDEWTRPLARIEERLVKPMTRGAWPWFEVYASRIT